MTFDIQQFMGTSFDGGLDTRLKPHPVGEYTGQIGVEDTAVSLSQGVSAKDGTPWCRCVVNIQTDDPTGNIFADLGRKPTARLDFLLDLAPGGGGLDLNKGRNIRLGQLLEACGLNGPGQKWTFNMMKGKAVKFKVTHEPRRDDPTIIDARVSAVSKVS